jgi:hypothetical protein
MTDILWTPLDSLLSGATITLTFLVSYLFFERAKQKDKKEEKSFLQSFALLFFGLALSGTVDYFAVFYYEGYFNGFVYVGVRNDLISPVFELYAFSEGIFFVSTILYYFQFERATQMRHHLISMIGILILIVYLILVFFLTGLLGLEIIQSLSYLIAIIEAIILLYTLLELAKKSSFEFQNITLSIIVGFLLFSMSTAIGDPEVLNVIYFGTIIMSALSLVGVFFYLIPLYFNIEKISQIRSSYLWGLIIFVNSITMVLAIYLLLVSLVFILIPLYFLIISFPITFLLVRILNQEKKLKSQSENLQAMHERKNVDVNLLNIFNRPQKITEEEVSVSKERKICLVCKGKLTRSIYLCPECNALYCMKCSDTLSTLENACWVCETSFDESRPVKHLEKESKKIAIEIGSHKKKQ